MKYIFTALFLFTSLEASGDIFDHFYAIFSVHLAESLLLLFFIILPFLLIVYFILDKKNEQLKIKVAEAVYDLEKAQSVAKIGSWIYDLKKNKLRWSQETYSMFEVIQNENDNLYEKFINRVHPDDRDELEDVYSTSLKNQTGYSLEHRLLMDDGSIKYVLERCESSFEEDGTPIISHGTVQDITESTLIKQELKEKDAYMFQQSRLALMGEMLSMIAHQWRQPLGDIAANNISIQTALELDRYDLKDDMQREDFLNFLNTKISKVSLDVKHLSYTVTNFSNFYRPDKEFKKTKVDNIVLKAYELLVDSLSASEIATEFKLESKCEILMHENEFIQVIINIINNAKDQLVLKNIKDPMIKIKTYIQRGKLYIEISDNAGGIDEEVLDKIFDPYYSTKLEKNGTGLGLYMSKVIIKDYHGGDIYAKNIENGAIFTIRIKVEDENAK